MNELTVKMDGASLAVLEELDVEKMLLIGATQRIIKLAESEAKTAKQVDLTFSRNQIRLSVRR